MTDKVKQESVDTIESLKEQILDYQSLIDAWVSTNTTSKSMLNEQFMDYVKGYLRTSVNGGMPVEDADMVISVIEDMIRLGYISTLIMEIVNHLRIEEK